MIAVVSSFVVVSSFAVDPLAFGGLDILFPVVIVVERILEKTLFQSQLQLHLWIR